MKISPALVIATVLSPVAVPAADELLIVGGRVHTLVGPPIEGGRVLIVDGRIAAVGTEVEGAAGVTRLEAGDHHVFPGLFDSMSTLGISEIASVRATVDSAELGAIQPHLLGLTAVHPPSEMIPVTRANGVTHAGVVPQSRSGYGFPGQVSAIQLDGWTAEEMRIEDSVGLVLVWPTLQLRSFDRDAGRRVDRPFKEAMKEYDKKVEEIRQWLVAGGRYAHARGVEGSVVPDRDLRLESLARVVEGRLPVIVRADRARQIRDAVELATSLSLRMILAGGREAWKEQELLLEAKIPVILGASQALPLHEDDPYDRSYTLAGELHEAGIPIAFSTFSAEKSRVLPYEAGQAVAFGLPWEEAVRAISRRPAEILGLGDRFGTLEPGKVANLIITDGDPLEIRTQVLEVIIRGQPVDLDNKHTRLYNKYRARRR